jgi:Carbohydrate binding module (family 35)
LPRPDTDRPPVEQNSAPLGTVQRWLYHGRRHQRRLLPQQRTAVALLGTAAVALVLILTVAFWPTTKRNNVVLPEIPRSTPTTAPTLPSPDNPDNLGTPSPDEPSGTAVPGQPPLPTGAPTPPPARNTGGGGKQPAPKPPPHNISPISFEAEAASSTLIGQARIRNNRDASGGHAIGFLGSAEGSSGALRMNSLNVPVPGTYTMTIFYISGDGDRDARIRLNDGTPINVHFPSTGDWNTVGSLALRGTLNAGSNTVLFDNPNDWAPDIDRLVISN